MGEVMKASAISFRCFLALVLVVLLLAVSGSALAQAISLPRPRLQSKVSVEEAIQARRSIRAFARAPLQFSEVAQIVWAAQGITESAQGRRAAPSAGALYPVEIYLAVTKGGVEGLEVGVYRYDAANHGLQRVSAENRTERIVRAARNQTWAGQAALMVIIAGEYARTAVKYGERAQRYVHIEVGCVAENIFLQVQALGLRAGIIGAFDDASLQEAATLPAAHEPLLIMPVGRPR